MTDWNQEFNDLPRDVRRIGQAMELQTRIQHLDFERDRLKKRYMQSCREIAEHRKNCERSLRGLDPTGSQSVDPRLPS